MPLDKLDKTPLKPIDDLTDANVKKMKKEEFIEYESQMLSDLDIMKMTLMAQTDKFHELCILAKRHGAGYMQPQSEAYDIRKSSKQIYVAMRDTSFKFLKLRRKWEHLNNKNQVRSLVRTTRGTYVLIS